MWTVVVQTGWNGSTVMDIDIESDWFTPHPVEQGVVVMQSIKKKAGGTVQSAVCDSRIDSSPYAIITRLTDYTASARANWHAVIARRTPAQLLQALSRRPCEGVATTLTSPWVYANAQAAGGLEALNRGSVQKARSRQIGYSREGAVARTVSAWGQFLYQFNCEREARGEKPVSSWIKLSDMRDAFIAHAYTRSGYQWLSASAAAGHTALESTQDYLGHLHWVTHTRDRLRLIQRTLWTGLAKGRLDVEAMRKALLAQRTGPGPESEAGK